MLPIYKDDLTQDFKKLIYPTKTYAMQDKKMNGKTDGLEAMKQAVYLILQTEQYEYAIYSWHFGARIAGLFGQPIPYVYAEIKDAVIDALMQDDRIVSVDGFTFQRKKGIVSASFSVGTIFGEFETGVEVRV